MQEPKYAGKYGVEQQLALLSKWLAESGFGEAAMLVSTAAMSVKDATDRKRLARLRSGAALVASPLAPPPRNLAPREIPLPEIPLPEIHDKRRARSA